MQYGCYAKASWVNWPLCKLTVLEEKIIFKKSVRLTTKQSKSRSLYIVFNGDYLKLIISDVKITQYCIIAYN